MKVEVLSNLVGLKPLKRRRTSADYGEENHQREGKECSKVLTAGSLYQKRLKNNTVMTVTTSEIGAFFKLFDDDVIQGFLWMDACHKVADKYLLAMVFAYFKRANFSEKQINRMNFFIALYLANDMEEDEEDPKYDIFPWALGRDWKDKYPSFLKQRDKLLRAIDYRAAVSSRCCDEIMALSPDHVIWQRERQVHHGGAERKYPCDDDTYYPRGPDASPVHCAACCKSYRSVCAQESPVSVESPDSGFLYLSSCSDSSTDSAAEDLDLVESFNINGLGSTLQQTLPFDESNIWAV